ncbi:MAG: endonuclease [Bacteroidota bacterium]
MAWIAILLFVAGTFAAPAAAQDVIHYWNFNDPVEDPPAWPAPVEANTGDGTLTYTFTEGAIQSFGGSSTNAQNDDPAGESFVVQGGSDQVNNGEYFDLNVSTEGFEDIEIAYATRGTSSGFDEQAVAYSTDGGSTFTDLETITTPGSFSLQALDMSGDTATDDNTDLVVRFTLDGATGASGNNRFDNITVEGTPLDDGGDNGDDDDGDDGGNEEPAPPTDGEAISINDARDQVDGSEVIIEGTVSRAFGSYARIQDESGATGASGIVLRQVDGDNSTAFQSDIEDGTIQPGTTLRVSGTVSEFNNLVQINGSDLTGYEVVEQGASPEPIPVSVSDVTSSDSDSNYESVLVSLSGLSFSGVEPGETFESGTSYAAQNTAGEQVDFRVQDDLETNIIGAPIPDGAFNYEGVVGVFFDNRQLIPVRESDVESVPAARFNRLYTRTLEGDNSVSVSVRPPELEDGQSVDVTVTAEGDADPSTDVTGFSDPTTFTFTGPDAAPETITIDIVDDGEEEGIERLELTLEGDDEVGAAFPATHTFWIQDDATAQTTLYPDLEGTELAEQLRDDFGDPATYEYDVARDSLYGRVFNENEEVEAFYTGFTAPLLEGQSPSASMAEEGINAEHLWPQSLGAGELPARSNMHILVPARENVNSARSNFPFGVIAPDDVDTWYRNATSQNVAPPESEQPEWSRVAGNRFEPRDVSKGEVARALFYFQLVYPGRADGAFLAQQEEDLRTWHEDHPVSEAEQRRNVLIASQQSNKLNPFALDPSLIDRVNLTPESTELTIAEARQADENTLVTVEGTVSRAFGSYARIQDNSGDDGASGLTIRQTLGSLSDDFQQDIEDGTIQPGTVVRVTSFVSEFNGLVQLNNDDVTSYEVVEQADPPAPASVSLNELAENGGSYESELVTVSSPLTITDAASDEFENGTSYTVENSSGDALTFRVQGDDESALGSTSIPEGSFFYTGVVGVFNDEFQLIPMRPSDLDTDTDVEVVEIARSFDDPTQSSSYRLVALPGQIDVDLASTLTGEQGPDWRAFRETGAEDASDALESYDGSEAFSFQPGNGFWVIAQDDWSFSGEVTPTESITEGDAAIPLQDGWNVVSNPLLSNLDWDAVQTANSLSAPLWMWDGAWEQADTFTSATEGEAYYLLNEDDQDALTLPISNTGAATTAETTEAEAPAEPRTLTLAGTTEEDAPVSGLTVTFAPDAESTTAHRAPPAHFDAAALRMQRGSDDYAALVVPSEAATQQFDLTLTGTPGSTVTLRLSHDGWEDSEVPSVRLTDAHTERTHTLTGGTASVSIGNDGTADLTLNIGAVEPAEDERPDALALRTNYPNPFQDQTTLEYTVPESMEVELTVYNMLGQRVATLERGTKTAGTHQLAWDGRTGGNALSSGVYFVRISGDGTTDVQRVTIIR